VAIRSDRFLAVQASADLTDFPCSHQEKKLWCWAACIQMVRLAKSGQLPLQCRVVADAFPDFARGGTECCRDPFNKCHRSCREDLVPDAFRGNGATARPVPLDDLTLTWIRTVVSGGGWVAVGWKGEASSHMVLVVRASPTEDVLGICDPDRYEATLKPLAKLKEPEDRFKGWKAAWVWQIT
jgi:hypothetical protein